MMKSKLILIITIITGLSACTSPGNKTAGIALRPDSLNWLTGSWKGMAGEGYFTESWTRLNDSVFTAKAFVIHAEDTVATEEISLVFDAGDVFYIPVVSNQNSGLPVKFKLTSFTNRTLIFENPTHDFPQKITYSHKDSDSLIAVISGTEKGRQRAERFGMKKVSEATIH